MKAAFPFVADDPATWAASGELLGHASAAAEHAGQQASAETTAALDDRLGWYLHTRGEFVRARQAHERALAIGERAYGPDHPSVATNVNNLGSVLRALGDLAGARAAFERALAIAKRFYASEHPKVRLYSSNLATLPPAPSQ